MRWLLLMVIWIPGTALASGVVRASVTSEHFGRTAETVIGLASDGSLPDEKAWRARADRELRSQVDHLEAALPRLREGFAAARGIVPLADPQGLHRRIDLSGDGWGWLELSFREEPSPQDLEVLRRALAQELQLRPLDRRRRFPVRSLFAAMAGVAAVTVVVLAVRRRRRRAGRSR